MSLVPETPRELRTYATRVTLVLVPGQSRREDRRGLTGSPRSASSCDSRSRCTVVQSIRPPWERGLVRSDGSIRDGGAGKDKGMTRQARYA
jgi:hypothetical protein